MSAPAVFYFDFTSPYAYLAAARIGDLIPDAAWTPIAFPILLNEIGRLEASMQRNRDPVVAEVSERAASRGLPPFQPAPGWPLETWSLPALRAALVAAEHGRLRDFALAAYRKSFAEGRSLTEPESLGEAAREAGLDPGEVEEGIQRPEIKQRLKDNTDEALARGVTGIPTVAVGTALFWGDDHLEEAAAAARTL